MPFPWAFFRVAFLHQMWGNRVRWNRLERVPSVNIKNHYIW